jgi:hypothetical protein
MASALLATILASAEASDEEMSVLLFTSSQWCRESVLAFERLASIALPLAVTRKVVIDVPLIDDHGGTGLPAAAPLPLGADWAVVRDDATDAQALYRHFCIDVVPSFVVVSRKTGELLCKPLGKLANRVDDGKEDVWLAMEGFLRGLLVSQQQQQAPAAEGPSSLSTTPSLSSADATRAGMAAYNDGDMPGAAKHFSLALFARKRMQCDFEAATTTTTAVTTTTTTVATAVTTTEAASSPPPAPLTDVLYNLGTVLLTCGKPLLAVPFLKDVTSSVGSFCRGCFALFSLHTHSLTVSERHPFPVVAPPPLPLCFFVFCTETTTNTTFTDV